MIANVILKVYLALIVAICLFFSVVAFDNSYILIGILLILVAIVTSIVLKWVYNNQIRSISPTLNSVTKEQERYYKNNFRTFFEGCYDIEPVIPTSITSFGITDVQFTKDETNIIIMTITLIRPGLLIGKGGATIDAITNHLSNEEQPVKIELIESKLWN